MNLAAHGDVASYTLVAFLFGVFCAYWAQETRRSAWLWFFLGLLLPPVAGIALLSKNAVRREQSDQPARHGSAGDAR